METVRYIYNGANQVACIDADASGACNGTEFWTYDAHGNLTFDRATRYVYDAANHLATVCDSGDGLACDALGNETTYQYNGDGARVAQSVRKGILPATVTTYTLDTNLPLTQVLSETTNGQTTRYLHGLDLIAESDGVNTEYLVTDGLGSVRQIVDASGAILTSQTFDPYGQPYSEAGSTQSGFGFTGEETDENGLVYLRARYYNPAQGRFMQVDPSRIERNGYQYAASSPTMFTDPSGNCVDMQEILAFLSPIPGPRPALKDMWNECKANWSTFQNVASNPDNDFNNIAHSFTYYVNPLGIQVRNTWQGMAELADANSRWVGAGGYGQWLGKIELFGIAPGRWLGWGANTSSYYQNPEHPYRYVEDFGTIFGPTYSAGLTVAFIAQGSMAQARQTALAEAQANANVARQWASLNKYYPSSAIGTASPGTLSQLVNAFASQRAANAMMAMPEYQMPLGGAPVYNLLGQRLLNNVTLGSSTGVSSVSAAQEGAFSITEYGWQGYTQGSVPRPVGPFRILTRDEWLIARAAADRANKALHAADPSLAGKQIHEIQPVKFGGSPTDPANKIALNPGEHLPYTRWWAQLQRALLGQ